MSGTTRKLFVLMAVCVFLSAALPVFATSEENPELTLDQRLAAIQLLKMQPLLDAENETMWATVYEDPFGGFDKMQVGKAKSTRKAFLMSLLLPGAGQIYTKSNILKPIIFLGIEAAGIAGYLNFHGKGEDQRDLYQAYADEHWFYDGHYESETFHDGYIQWLDSDYPSAEWRYGDTAKWFDASQNQWVNTFSEHLGGVIDPVTDSLRPTRDHAYYENIGKYPQFQYGWRGTDFSDDNKDTTSEYKDAYLVMRKDANEEFNKATTMLIMTMANHLVSAFDAALSARRHNRKQDALAEIEFKMRYEMKYGQPTPKFTMSIRY